MLFTPPKWLKIGFCLLLAVCQKRATGQYLYEFNKNGELVTGAPEEFDSGQNFNVKIAFDTVLFKTQLDSFLVNLSLSRILWTNILRKLETMPAPNPPDPRLKTWKDSIREMLVEQRDLYGSLAGLPVAQLLGRFGSGGVGAPGNWRFVPRPESVVGHLKEQYRLKVNASHAPDCLLEPVLVPEDCAWYFQLSAPIPVIRDFKLYLYRENGLRSLVIDWYRTHRHLYPGAALTLFENAVRADQGVFNRMKQYSTRIMTYPTMPADSCPILNATMQQLIDSVPLMDFKKALDTVNMDDLQSWVLDMAWLDKGGQAQFDPLPVTDGGFYRDLSAPAPADKTDSVVMAKMAALLGKEDLKLENSKEYLSVWYKRDSTKNRQDSLTAAAKKKAAAADPAQTAAAALAAYEQTAQLLNIVQTPVTVAGKPILHIRQYYYNRRPDKRRFGYDYPENEQVVLAVNNRPVAQGVVVIDQKTPFTEQPLVTEEANQTLPAVALPQPTGPAGAPSYTIDWKLTADNAPAYASGMDQVFHAGQTPAFPTLPKPDPCLEQYKKLFTQFKTLFNRYRVWDSLYNLGQQPPLFLERTASDSPRMVTDVIYPDRAQKPPYQYQYKLTVRDTSKSLSLLNPLDSSGYRVGKRRLVELALGVAYAVTSARQVNVGADSSGNLQPSSTETKAQFVVGLKIHVKKVYWENNQFALSCKSLRDGTFWTRVSFFAGASIPSPLNNLYTGVGLDFIPGLNVNGGVQWYQYNSFTVNNNQVLDQRAGYRPAIYVALTADPTLVVNIVKNFF
jgi:hypothetical protein